MSDLIGKSLLFVGYSFQDENVQKLFNEIRHVFDGKMPSSYLISFDESGELENTCHEFGIKFLLPRRHFPDEQTDREAFERCLKSLCDLTVQFQGEQELENLFSPPTPRAERMVTPSEVEAVAAAIATGDIDVSLNTFRGTIVHSLIPESVQMGVVDIFTKLTVSADMANPRHVQCLRVCLMSLRLPAALAAQVMVSFMAALNQRPAQIGFDELMPLNSHALPEGFMSVAAALAITMLNDRAEAITDGFRRTAHGWFQDYNLAPPELGEQIRQAVNLAWSGTRAADSPLEYWKKFGGLLRMKTAEQIANGMMETMPHKLRAPSDSLRGRYPEVYSERLPTHGAGGGGCETQRSVARSLQRQSGDDFKAMTSAVASDN